MIRIVVGLVGTLIASLGIASPLVAGDLAQAEFFEKRVRPILVERCHSCHSETVAESDLRLDGMEHLLRGGTRGAAIVPGDPNASLLVLAINHADTLHMPPKQKLRPREIADLTEWVRSGAYWPNAPKVNLSTTRKQDKPFTGEELGFWAFQRPIVPVVPETKRNSICQTPIDRFWQKHLDAAGVNAASPASDLALMRRISFDLTGLPPATDVLESFLQDPRPDRLERQLDRLMASPRYGERWGRRWLDIARFADSNGLDENLAYASAFHYRDYVVSAFNQDKPYDRFIREQIAGDLFVDPNDVEAWNESLTATGFLCVGAKMLAEDDQVKMQMDIIDEQIDTLGQAVLGITLGCSRCHDHKFDPIRTEDYYALAGIFKSTKTMENFKVVARWQERPLGSPEQVKRRADSQQRVAERKAELDRLSEVASSETLREARRHVGDYLLAVAQSRAYDELLKNTKSIGGTVTPTTENAIFFEAESYQRGNVRKDLDQYGKDIGVLVNRGETPNFVEYDFEVKQEGLYQFEIRYAAATPRPCSLLIDGRSEKAAVARQATGSWYPDSQTWFVEAFIGLRPGQHTLRLEHPKSFPHIDKWVLSLVPTPREDMTRSVLVTNRESEDRLRNVTISTLDLVHARQATHYQPIPALVRQWDSYLSRLSDDADSPVRMWKGFSTRSSAWSSERPIEAECLRRIGPQPGTPAELAGAYNRLFSQVVEAWESLKGTNEGKSLEKLPDEFSETLRSLLYDASGPFAKPPNNGLEPSFSAETKSVLQAVRDKVAALEKEVPQLPEVMAVSDGKVENIRVHLRGSHVTLGEQVSRGFPRIFGPTNYSVGDSESGRRELANWLTDNHPLTGRVMVNRIWLGHFGAGIVRTPDNFGQLGERPTHPDLLDWLAVRFEQDGWSVKAMHRLMLVSHCYQIGQHSTDDARDADPENRLLSEFRRRRLEAEELRDALIDLGEGLDLTMKGTMLNVANRQYVTSTTSVNPAIYETRRRSIYLPIVRSAIYEVFQAFDFPDPSTLHGLRESTTVASQALFMLNSPLVAQQARAAAQRLLQDHSNDAIRIARLIKDLLGRDPSAGETEHLLLYVDSLRSRLGSSDLREEEVDLRAWQMVVRTILSSNEFLYLE